MYLLDRVLCRGTRAMAAVCMKDNREFSRFFTRVVIRLKDLDEEVGNIKTISWPLERDFPAPLGFSSPKRSRHRKQTLEPSVSPVEWLHGRQVTGLEAGFKTLVLLSCISYWLYVKCMKLSIYIKCFPKKISVIVSSNPASTANLISNRYKRKFWVHFHRRHSQRCLGYLQFSLTFLIRQNGVGK